MEYTQGLVEKREVIECCFFTCLQKDYLDGRQAPPIATLPQNKITDALIMSLRSLGSAESMDTNNVTQVRVALPNWSRSWNGTNQGEARRPKLCWFAVCMDCRVRDNKILSDPSLRQPIQRCPIGQQLEVVFYSYTIQFIFTGYIHLSWTCACTHHRCYSTNRFMTYLLTRFNCRHSSTSNCPTAW